MKHISRDTVTLPVDEIPEGWHVMDIGTQTVKRFTDQLKQCKTVIWNGPMGVFELAPFAEGTKAVAEALASATGAGATTVVGGGETASAVVSGGMSDRISHVSTGGGASLEFLEGKVLPGVEALSDREEGVKTRE